jgi:hypothetical protein
MARTFSRTPVIHQPLVRGGDIGFPVTALDGEADPCADSFALDEIGRVLLSTLRDWPRPLLCWSRWWPTASGCWAMTTPTPDRPRQPRRLLPASGADQ